MNLDHLHASSAGGRLFQPLMLVQGESAMDPACLLDQRFRLPVAVLCSKRFSPSFLRENVNGILSHQFYYTKASGSFMSMPAIVSCRRGHSDNSGRFEDSAGAGGPAGGRDGGGGGGGGDHLGAFNDICKGDKKRSDRRTNGDSFDFSRPRPAWNGSLGDAGLRSGFLHDCSDYNYSSSSSSKDAIPYPSSLPGEDRIIGRSIANGYDEILHRGKVVRQSLEENPFCKKIGCSNLNGLDLKNKVGAAGMPMSLRMLKKKQNQNRAIRQNGSPNGRSTFSHGTLLAMGESTYCSFRKAFSSMVFMIRTLQSYTIQLRQAVICEDLQEILVAVQRELHSSFLWLFQQVFACTPKLMLSVMLLLANYTVFSMGNHIAAGSLSLLPTERAVSEVSMVDQTTLGQRQSLQAVFGNLNELVTDVPTATFDVAVYEDVAELWDNSQTENGAGGSSRSLVLVSGASEGPGLPGDVLWNGAIFSSQDLNVKESSDFNGKQYVTKQAKTQFQPLGLDPSTKKDLIAPDNYSCYDRTELIYQHAICNDVCNAMILANYAQFLFLVRHDHDRAEQLFVRAIRADPRDADIIGRYASFLWLARGDRMAAEKAYKTVVNLDPTNPYFTGIYANFLWHAVEEEAVCSIKQQPADNMTGVSREELT